MKTLTEKYIIGEGKIKKLLSRYILSEISLGKIPLKINKIFALFWQGAVSRLFIFYFFRWRAVDC